MVAVAARLSMALLMGGLVLGASACAPLKMHQGYVIDADLVNSVQPNVDNRQSVLSVLGKPSFTGEFDKGEWYYVSRDTRNYQFNLPHASSQVVLRIRFDQAGVVRDVSKSGIEQIASISPYGKVTPTLGHHRGFFQDLFGNIGTVGAGGGMNPSTGGGGAGRTQP